jgi:hypothetical protein
MVPWYTVEPPTNGLCPKHCSCAVYILEHDVRNCLEDYYDHQVLRITEQAERITATKDQLLHFASTSYWEGKAEFLKIPPHLMDITAPLPPCVSPLVERQLEGFLEDFNDLEEWFFAFKKAPTHEQQSTLEGYEDGSYSATLKKRREDRATFLALTASYTVEDPPLPLFGPSSKKLKQTTLTQSYTESLDDQKPVARPMRQVIDLTISKPPKVTDCKQKARRVDHTTKPSYLSPPSTRTPEVEPPFASQFSFTTPEQHDKMR